MGKVRKTYRKYVYEMYADIGNLDNTMIKLLGESFHIDPFYVVVPNIYDLKQMYGHDYVISCRNAYDRFLVKREKILNAERLKEISVTNI